MKPAWKANGGSWEPQFPTTNRLKPSAYVVYDSELWERSLIHDKAIIVEDAISAKVIASVKVFWNSVERYKRFNLLHKRGFLLHGAPGTGKTMTAMTVAEFFIDNGGVIFMPYNDRHIGEMGNVMKMTRAVNPDIPILVLLEDIDKYDVQDKNNESRMLQLLALLDGESQVNNVVYMATTNHIWELDHRLTNRPSRFDEVLEVGAPSASARESYLRQIIPDGEVSAEALSAIVAASDGLYLSHMRELVAAHLVMGKPLVEVVDRLHRMNSTGPYHPQILAAKAKAEKEAKKAEEEAKKGQSHATPAPQPNDGSRELELATSYGFIASPTTPSKG